MGTDILERLRKNAARFHPHATDLLREAAAEIGRLRGELAVANECLGEERAANVLRTPAPAMPNGVDSVAYLLDELRFSRRGYFTSQRRGELADKLETAIAADFDRLRAADNRDAAGVAPSGWNYERMFLGAVGMLAEISVALGIPDDVAACANGNAEILEAIAVLKATPAAVPAGEAVAWIRDNLPESLHGMGVVDVLQLLLDGGIAAEKDLIDAESPQPADGEAVAEWQVWHKQDGWGATHPDNVAEYRARGVPVRPLYAHPPAPVQAAPQEGDGPWLGEALRFLGELESVGNLRAGEVARGLRRHAANPSACELGAWNDAIEAAASEAEHWQARSGSTHKCGDYIAGAIRSMKRAALQHRGDSRGGEA